MCLIIFNVNQLKKNDIILMIILIFFEFFIIFIISSLRTYFIGFIVTIILIFFYFSKNRIKILLSVLSFLLFLSFVNIAKYNNYLYDRFGFLENLMYFDIGGVFSGNFIYGFKEFDTYYWRLMEIIYVNGFKFEWYQLLFGNMGRYYEFNGFYAIAPHISYFGVFYLFGLVGVIGVYYTYIYFTLSMFRNITNYKGSRLYFLSIFIFIAWINILIQAFSGGSFYSENTLIIAILFWLTSFLKLNLKRLF